MSSSSFRWCSASSARQRLPSDCACTSGGGVKGFAAALAPAPAAAAAAVGEEVGEVSGSGLRKCGRKAAVEETHRLCLEDEAVMAGPRFEECEAEGLGIESTFKPARRPDTLSAPA